MIRGTQTNPFMWLKDKPVIVEELHNLCSFFQFVILEAVPMSHKTRSNALDIDLVE